MEPTYFGMGIQITENKTLCQDLNLSEPSAPAIQPLKKSLEKLKVFIPSAPNSCDVDEGPVAGR
jgi:hypothetical protein